jgi:hypothetical protein
MPHGPTHGTDQLGVYDTTLNYFYSHSTSYIVKTESDTVNIVFEV